MSLVSRVRNLCDSVDGFQSSFPRYCTNAAIEDDLVCSLYGVTTPFLDEDYKIRPIRQKYVEQAKAILYRINVFQPVPVFVINSSDLPKSLRRELEKFVNYPEQFDEIIMGAVSRILEDVNPRYFRVSGVRRSIRWRIDP